MANGQQNQEEDQYKAGRGGWEGYGSEGAGTVGEITICSAIFNGLKAGDPHTAGTKKTGEDSRSIREAGSQQKDDVRGCGNWIKLGLAINEERGNAVQGQDLRCNVRPKTGIKRRLVVAKKAFTGREGQFGDRKDTVVSNVRQKL